jgi:hypothetical protein
MILGSDEGGTRGLMAVVPTMATVVLLRAECSPVARLLSWSPLTRMVDVSYSWYFLHWPAVVFGKALGISGPILLAAVGLGTFPVAARMYSAVELRFQLSSLVGLRPGRIAGGSVIATTAAIAISALQTSLLAGLPAVGSGMRSLDLHADRTCGETDIAPDVQACESGHGAAGLALVGDSNAGQLVEAVLAGVDLGAATVTLVSRASCPTLELQLTNDGIVDDGCGRAAAAVEDWLAASRPALLILAAASDLHLQRPGRVLSR